MPNQNVVFVEFFLHGDRAYRDYFVGNSEKSILDATQNGTTYAGGQKYESHRIVSRAEMDQIKGRMAYQEIFSTSVRAVEEGGVKHFRIGQIKIR